MTYNGWVIIILVLLVACLFIAGAAVVFSAKDVFLLTILGVGESVIASTLSLLAFWKIAERNEAARAETIADHVATKLGGAKFEFP